MTRRLRGALVLLASVLAGATASAQQTGQRTRCELVPQETTRLHTDTILGGGRVTFLGGGVLIRCPARKITLRGDSAEQYPDRDFMVGHVIYDEPRFHLTSDFLNHFTIDDRIVAVGNVHARHPNGSTLDGPVAEYRAASRTRPRRQVIAKQRPTITVAGKDSAGKPAPPMVVVADSIFMDGDSLIYGSGQVIITRPDIRATGDSAFIDEGRETMKLWQRPEINGKKDRPFSLTGTIINLYSKDKKLQRVIAREKAVAVSDSMTLASDTIDLRIKNDVLDRAYAWGKSRAKAVSPSQTLLADSLDVLMPNSKVSRVRAVKKAYAEAKTDTTKFKAVSGDKHDWLKGDTIVAHFDTATAKDTSKAPKIRQLVASGNASSYYHLAPSDTAERRPAIDYLIARLIRIDFNQQRNGVATVTAVDSVSGVYVEPKADTTARRTRAAGPAANAPKTVIPLPPPKKP